MAPDVPREQEQSIKARKREMFEEEQGPAGPRRRFSEYVGQTPPARLSLAQKATLAALAALVLLLFLATLFTIPNPRGRQAAPASTKAGTHQGGGR